MHAPIVSCPSRISPMSQLTSGPRRSKPGHALSKGLGTNVGTRNSVTAGARLHSRCNTHRSHPSSTRAEASSGGQPEPAPLAEPSPDSGVCNVSTDKSCTSYVAETLLPTTSGLYRVRAYRHWYGTLAPSEPLAIICGDVSEQENVPVRVHDACFTSEVLGSMKCDCSEQLQYGLNYIKENGPGIVCYLQQEGRGIGLANKIAAYQLQEQGLDTVDANRALNLPDDSREYTAVANMLADLNVKSIRLMTNNPRKIEKLSSLGVKITDRIAVLIDENVHSSGYLKAKSERMDHMMEHLDYDEEIKKT